MDETPRFKYNIRIHTVPPDLCFFFHETGYQFLQGRLIFLIAPFINGRNSIFDIARKSKGVLTEFDVHCGLLLLEDMGLLKHPELKTKEGTETFQDLFLIISKAFADDIKNIPISLQSFGGVSITAFSSVLKTAGAQIKKNAKFKIVLVDDYLRSELKTFNRFALRKGLRWMLIKPTGTQLWFGPTFSESGNACWECMARRLNENLRGMSFFHGIHSLSSRQHVPSTTALNLAAIEAIRNLRPGKNQKLIIQTLDLDQMKLEEHSVNQSNECHSCFALKKKSSPTNVKVVMHKRDLIKKSVRRNETQRKFDSLISPLTGLVNQLEPPESSGPFYLCNAVHSFVQSPDKNYPPYLRLKRTSTGKGLTPHEAATGAVCEALERLSGVFRGDETRIKASYNEIKDDAIHPNQILNFSDAQYTNREKTNAYKSEYDWVPVPFRENKKIEWTPVWSLTDKQTRYVPTAYCYYGYSLPADERFCRADSNGNAAGKTLEDAIQQGFLELVERDAAAIWWFNRIPRPILKPDTGPLPYIKRLLDQYRGAGRTLHIFDITNDFCIPTIAAVSLDKDPLKSNLLFGTAAHSDPAVAASKALMEMNQLFDKPRIDSPAASENFIRPDNNFTKKRLADFNQMMDNDVSKNIKIYVQIAKKLGMEIFILDQTRTDIGLPVVKVIVPGMRQLWSRFGKGRLYDIPVVLGWLKTPTPENELNPYSILI